MERNLKQNEDSKIILDKKIQQNNIDLEKYKYSDYDRAYKRFENGRYDGVMYEIALDEKGYLTERFYGEEPGERDTDFVTVYDDDGNTFYFTTMDDSYDYECKNGNLYYVGYFNHDIYGIVHHPDKENKDGITVTGSVDFSKVLYEDKDLDFFNENKTEILSNYINMHEKTIVAQMQTNERKVPDLTAEQKEATQNFLASKFGTKEETVSAYEQTKEAFSDILPAESTQPSLEDSMDIENMFS